MRAAIGIAQEALAATTKKHPAGYQPLEGNTKSKIFAVPDLLSQADRDARIERGFARCPRFRNIFSKFQYSVPSDQTRMDFVSITLSDGVSDAGLLVE